MNFVDTHCHLVSKSLAENIPALLESANKAGVTRIINVGCDLNSSKLACEQLAFSPMLSAAVGIQPHDADTFSEAAAQEIALLARMQKRVVAIGELGLDGHYKLSNMNRQIDCFRHFLGIAVQENLPVIVHMRNTFHEVYSSLAEFSQHNIQGVIHCFTGDIQQARAFLDLGFYISFSGIITFKNPSEYEEVVKYIPFNRILCETDAPYLTPKPHRGRQNEPSFVRHTYETVATMRGETLENISANTTQNALRLFSRMNENHE